MTLSLRSRLLIGIILGIAIILCAFSIAIYSSVHHTLISNFDADLINTAKILSAITEQESDYKKQNISDINTPAQTKEKSIEFELNPDLAPQFSSPAGGAYYQFIDSDGNSIIRSPSLQNSDLNFFKNLSDKPQPVQCKLPNNSIGRAVGFTFAPKNEKKTNQRSIAIIVAKDASAIYSNLNFLKSLLIFSSALAILISVIIAALVAKASLKPVHALANEIAEIDADDLQNTAISNQCPAELTPLVNCLKDLITRIKASFEREKQFNANIAHELRTPLAGLRSTIEVTLTKLREVPDYQQAMQTCLDISKSMNRMIDSLLSLAKLESKQVTLNFETIPINETIENCWLNFADKAIDNNITFENNIDPQLTCLSDKAHLSMIFNNILENAVEHSSNDQKIWTTAQPLNDCVVVSVSNTGCKIKPEQIKNIFDPFWTADTARQNTGKHFGIGLTIVKTITKAINASITATLTPENTFTINLTLPLCPREESHRDDVAISCSRKQKTAQPL